MYRWSLVRLAARVVILAFVASACTSAPAPPAATGRPTRSTTATTSAPPSSAGTALAITRPLVAIRSPQRGSLRVRGLYPWKPSPCVHPERPTLDGRYPGVLSIRRADDGTLTATVTLTFEQYLDGIAEVPPTWPMAALQAQAIAARSYALSTTGWSGPPGASLDTPICGTTACQVYGGIPTPRPPGQRRWYAAVRATRGQVLLYGGRPADTVYFSTSNGHTYGNDQVFGSSPLPYLRPVPERDDGSSPLSQWHVEVPFGDLTRILHAAGSWPGSAPIARSTLEGGALRVVGGGASRILDATTLRDAVNTWAPCLFPRRYPTDGLPLTIPSGWLTLSSNARGVVVEGRGWGHGVGMVQWGAYGKAVHGWSTSKILAFYYGGLTPQRYPEPGTIHVVVATGLRSMTVDPSGPGATIGGRKLAGGKLDVTGGAAVTVTSDG